MAKKDISKILTTGSIRQRLLLIAEETARGKHFQEKLLTDNEYNQLIGSIKKPNEIKLYHEFKETDETVTNALINLQGLLFEVKMHFSNLRGYLLTWYSIENAELLANSILHEIKDPKERKRIAEGGAKGFKPLFSSTEVDPEGYIDTLIDFERDSYRDENGKIIPHQEKPRKTKEYSLWQVMSNVKEETETALIKYLSWEKALLDYMDDRGFNVKTYKKGIKELGDQIYYPIIGWPKYSGKINTGLEHPRLDKIIQKYAMCPNVEELEIDQEEYDWYRKYFLDRGTQYPEELRGKLNKKLSE